MAKIKTIPVPVEVIGNKDNLLVNPKYLEVVPTRGQDTTPFREFTLSGDVQNGVVLRVYNLSNSDTPKPHGLTKVKSISGLKMTTKLEGLKEVIIFEASELRLEKSK